MAIVLSSYVKEIRTSRKLTQAGLAQIMGVEARTIRRWEDEKARPSKRALRQLNRLGNNGRG